MFGALFIGIGVGLLSFGALEVIVRTKPAFTLPALLLAILAGQLLRLAFAAEAAGLIYLMGWMLAMSVSVTIGFAMRAAARSRNNKPGGPKK